MGRSRRRRRWPWVILFSAIALVAVFYIGGAWYFSGQVYAEVLKADPYDPAGLQRGTVAAYDATSEQPTVTILPDVADREETKFDEAVVGLAIDESLLVVGPATRGADGEQTRPVLDLIGDAPKVGDRYGLTRDVWLDPEQAGLDAQDVVISTPDGRQFPAWQVSAEDSSKWAILTHGKGASRSEMLRMARALHGEDYNVLIITYTGDVGAPPYDDGMVHYGRTEWQELEAAVEFADAAGAETIVLGGASHGGAVTLGFLARGNLARKVDGLILDAPASSLEEVIDEAAEFRSLPVVNQPIPESLEDAAKLAVAFRYGVDFSAIDYTDMQGLIGVPLLTFQGVEDSHGSQGGHRSVHARGRCRRNVRGGRRCGACAGLERRPGGLRAGDQGLHRGAREGPVTRAGEGLRSAGAGLARFVRRSVGSRSEMRTNFGSVRAKADQLRGD